MIRVFALLLFVSLSFLACQPKTVPTSGGGNINAEITRIENNLKRSFQIVGEEAQTYSIEERLAFYNVPNVSVAVIEDGKVRWAKGYGVADPEKGTKVDAQTLFQAASISKPVAGMGVLRLVQSGALDLDTDVNKYLKSWKVPDSKFTKEEKVTLRGLLTHSAGVTVHGFPGYKQTDKFPNDVEVLNGKGNTGAIFVDTFPRTINRYSGGGYTIMERVVEDVTGQDFADYMQSSVLTPNGMTRSTYQQPLPTDRQDNVSVAYNGGGQVYPGKWHNYPEQAAAGLWTTPTDLAQFAIGIQKSLAGSKGQVLGQDIAQQMVTKDKLGHGLGPGVSGKGDSLVFQHGGKNAGFTCHMMAYAHLGKGIVAMSGADAARPLIQEIQMAIAEEYGWNVFKPKMIKTIQQSQEELKARIGTYIFKDQNYKVYVTVQDDHLVIVDPNNNNKKYPMRSMTELDMIDLVDGDKISFIKDADGNVTGLKQNDYYLFEKVN